MLIANPVPKDNAADPEKTEKAIKQALKEC